MADDIEAAEDEQPKKKSKGLLFGLIGAVALGGGAFFGVYSGMIPLPFGDKPEEAESEEYADKGEKDEAAYHSGGGPVAFVPLDPIIVSLGPTAKSKHLKVSVSIEVNPESEEQVTMLTPRVIDVLNTFLRAVDEREFEVPRAMMRLRAQMLRRVQLVTPQGAVRDLLIQEFILN
jgi:flagellar FliL protein